MTSKSKKKTIQKKIMYLSAIAVILVLFSTFLILNYNRQSKLTGFVVSDFANDSDSVDDVVEDSEENIVEVEDETEQESNVSIGDVKPDEQQTHYVELKDYAFNPEVLTIKKGDTVVWTNLDYFKNTVSSFGQPKTLNSGVLFEGDTYEYTFDEGGGYRYLSITSGYVEGKIIVEG